MPLPRSGGVTSTVLRWWSRSAGSARSTAAPGEPARTDGAIDPDAALSAARRRSDHGQAALGHSHQRRALAALLPGRALRCPSSSSRSISRRSSTSPATTTASSPSTAQARRHCLKLFALVFRREGFLPGAADERTFHQRAIEEGRFYEERVAANLSELVFGQVFPELARAIAAAAPEAPCPRCARPR